MYHQLEVSESLQFRRWSLHLDDSFSYLPQSSFGFVMFGVTSSSSQNITFLNPSVAPSQSILTSQSMRLSDVFLAQAEVQASQRTTFTFTAGYGVLHYTSPGFLNPTNADFGFGYNYALSARDTLGVSYSFNNFTFPGTNSTINDSSFQFTYGHHVSNRLMFQVGVGPGLDYFKPVGFPVSTETTLFTASGSISYQAKQGSISASFMRGVSGGAGIIFGSVANTAQVSATHQWGRNLTATGNFGFSYNQSLPQTSGLTTASFSSLYAGAGITYKASRSANFFANYNFIHQITNAPVCVGVTCAPNFDSHQIWIGFNFEFRPIPLY
jgi:hypothetical protein